VQEGRVVRFQNNNVELNNLQQTRSPRCFHAASSPLTAFAQMCFRLQLARSLSRVLRESRSILSKVMLGLCA
jgi:hypothetical protein